MNPSLEKASAIGGAGMPIIKKWEEQTVEEKLETLRQEAMGNRYTSQAVYRLREKIQGFVDHSHDSQGRMVVPVDKYDRSDSCDSAKCSFDRLA